MFVLAFKYLNVFANRLFLKIFNLNNFSLQSLESYTTM
ncbi:hypothetical protein HFN_1776 [Helicobacter fennelliae MRY12-0050]|uniref:Uncharacterized protein n=1 Tax=Helicobacter fennelliae MRY12-0050 TaxID=1325130 RepID=T1DUT2_9HELI|nr:hypothetical protein HFN_1776 [Helicobacter fennelliae MRY12-0050]